MRRLWFWISLGLLLFCLLLLRRYRFEQVAGTTVVPLSELHRETPDLPPGSQWKAHHSYTGLRLDAGPGQVALRMELPRRLAVDALHMKFRMAAEDLRRGGQEWEDGRLSIEWRSEDQDQAQEIDPVSSLRGDQKSEASLVVRPAAGPSVPILRIENLGRSGAFEILQLEMTPVRERFAWRVGRWLLLGAWGCWLFTVLSQTLRTSFWRKALATAIWSGMGITFAFPGPWKTLHPLVIPFDLGSHYERAPALQPPEANRARETANPLPAASKAAAVSLGKILLTESWILKVKRVLADGRPLLHALLLFAPTLLFALLLGARHAWYLGGSLALAIEAAQAALGFGFDLLDVGDLACNAVGVAAAIGIYSRIGKYRLARALS